MRKGQRSWEGLLGPNSRNKANMAKVKNLNLAIIASATLKAVLCVLLQSNAMLMMLMKIQQAILRRCNIQTATTPRALSFR